MHTLPTTRESSPWRAGALVGACLTVGLLLTACEEPKPRTFAEFIEDRMVMEGTLARCNEDRDATLNDIECANARRAASALALRIEQQRREDLERESERKLAALRDELARQERSARDALTAAVAAREAEYEAQWNSDLLTGKRSPEATPSESTSENGQPMSTVEVDNPEQTSAAPQLPVQESRIPRPFREDNSLTSNE